MSAAKGKDLVFFVALTEIVLETKGIFFIVPSFKENIIYRLDLKQNCL